MGVKWTGIVRITFEMQDGQPEGLARTVLTREAGQLKHAIERGLGIAPTGVKSGSAEIEIVEQGPSA